jgi:hypothetical protein
MRRFLFGLFSLVIFAVTGCYAQAGKFIPTVYSDGSACPHDCDAHVVFNTVHNGTKYASLPSSSRSSPVACAVGSACRICFDDHDNTCMEAVYRGGGPSKWRFDFTPAFYEAKCSTTPLPAAFAAQCASFSEKYESLTKDAVYCIAEPAAKGCPAVIAKANAAKAADKVLWDECRSLGQKAFNKKYAKKRTLQRSLACAYELHGTGGPNSKGESWLRLLPAACYAGSYVDRSGLDCCDANKMSLGGLGKECSIYSVPKL